MPACPQRNAAPISAINSSRLYSSEPKPFASVMVGRFNRLSWPVLCVNS
jgi:hypothetical protein